MKIDWLYLSIIVAIIAVFVTENRRDNNSIELKLKQIEYCREMKIENCPEVK